MFGTAVQWVDFPFEFFSSKRLIHKMQILNYLIRIYEQMRY